MCVHSPITAVTDLFKSLRRSTTFFNRRMVTFDRYKWAGLFVSIYPNCSRLFINIKDLVPWFEHVQEVETEDRGRG